MLRARLVTAIVGLTALGLACSASVGSGAAPGARTKDTETRLVPLTATVGVVAPAPSASTAVPVASEVPCSSRGVAVVLLLETSASMRGPVIEALRTAAERAAFAIDDQDLIEIIAFGAAPRRLVRLNRASKSRPTLKATLAGLSAAGPAALFPALDAAYQDLDVVAVCEKHVVLLSSGGGPTEGLRELAEVLVSEGMTLTVLGLGSQVDVVTLRLLADVAGGRFRAVTDLNMLPDVVAADVGAVRTLARKRESAGD